MSHQQDYAVDIEVPGFKLRVRNDATVIWLCTTVIFCCSVLAMLLLVFRQAVRA